MPEARPTDSVAVLGGGSWGTALAWLLAGKQTPVRLWCRTPEQAEEIARERRNRRYLPDLPLPDALTPTACLDFALGEAATVVVAVPVHAVRATLRLVGSLAPPEATVLLAAKGLERDSGLRLTEVAAEELSPGQQVAVLSGPNLAGEIVRGIPTATVVAATDPECTRRLQELLATPTFRVYTNSDVIGVELGGALKNPVALAAGISDGLGFGANTRASLLTRGLAEMVRLGEACGARRNTFSGLSGVGDLLATAHSPLSRNYRLGLAVGRGENPQQASAELHQVAEGMPTAEAACRLAEKKGVEVPIILAVRRILFQGQPVLQAVGELLARPYRDEDGSG